MNTFLAIAAAAVVYLGGTAVSVIVLALADSHVCAFLLAAGSLVLAVCTYIRVRQRNTKPRIEADSSAVKP